LGAPQNYVWPFSHCEYDNGYIVFNRRHQKEVWRVASEWSSNRDISVASPLDQRQIMMAELFREDTATNTRGQFMPCALITVPEDTHAFRLFFPTLAVAGPNCYYLWDVRTGTLIQSVVDPDLNADSQVNYVEVSERHVFVSRMSDIHIYSRTDGRRVWSIDANFVPTHGILPGWDASIACILPQTHCWPISNRSSFLGPHPADPLFIAGKSLFPLSGWPLFI
jgi:hypothetical protein